MTVLPLCCFPNTVWLAAYLADDQIVIDVGEHFIKQTYRNRLDILGPNGVQTLSIPVVGQKGKKVALRNIHIEVGKWQKEHLNSIHTAYNAAPFAEHFLPDLEDLFNNPNEGLMDFNLKALALSLDWLDIDPKHEVSLSYVEEASTDLRQNQKRKQGEFTKYLQVFSDRMDFEENLSSIDLAMNCGNDGISQI